MHRWMASILLAGLCAARAAAQQPKEVKAEHPAHQELRAMKEKMQDAFNKQDLDALLKHVHPNAVITWQNAEVSRGPEGIRAYYKKMMEGPDRKVQKVTAKAEVDELTILYGDSNGLAFGTLDQDFTLTDGSDFHLKSRWTAHVVRENGPWLVSGLHVSADIFDNGALHLIVRRTALWTGVGALAAGLVVATIVCWLSGYRKKPVAGGTP